MQRQAEELGVKYETEQKEKEIQIRDQRILMLQQADMLRLASLRNAEFLRNVTIAGIIVIDADRRIDIPAGTGKSKGSRRSSRTIMRSLRTRTKMLEQVLAEKDWLLKEVHHRV